MDALAHWWCRFSPSFPGTESPSAATEAGCRTGIVTAVGPDAGMLEPGDKVLFPKDAGYDVRLAGSAVKVLRRSELIARIHD